MCAPCQWLCWISWTPFHLTQPQLPSCIFVFDKKRRYEMHITGTLPNNPHPRLDMNAAVRSNLNKGAKSWALLPKACCSAEVACLLIGYFQLVLRRSRIHCSLLKCFKANMNFLFFSGPLQTGWCLLTEGKSPLACLRWGGVKIGECDSPGYCSPRPLDDTWLLSRVCITHMHPQTLTNTCTHVHLYWSSSRGKSLSFTNTSNEIGLW